MAAKARASAHLVGAIGTVVFSLSLAGGMVAWGSAATAATSSPNVAPSPHQAGAMPVGRLQVSPMKPAPPPPPPTNPSGVDCSVLQCIALTFDDGPGPQLAGILSVLDLRKVKATFFLQGWRAAANPGAVATIAAAGHVIGNHSYNHPHFKGKSVEYIDAQLQQADDIIVAAGAPKPTLMRPPYGDNPAALKMADADMGKVGVLWDVDPWDWNNPGPDKVIADVLTYTQRGSIILLHDMWPGTVDALLPIIDNLLAKGFVFVTVPELIGDQPPGTIISHGPR